MNQPWIYMCSPSWSPLPPPSPPHPSGSSQCTSPEHLSHASNLGWWSVSQLIICCSLRASQPHLEPRVTLTVAGKPISFLIDTGATYFAVPACSRKTKASRVSVRGVEVLKSTPRITEPLPCTLQDTPFSHSFLLLPKCPPPIIGRDLLKIQSLYTIPSPPSDLPWLLHFNTHHFWRSLTTIGSFLFFQTKPYKQFLPPTRNHTATLL